MDLFEFWKDDIEAHEDNYVSESTQQITLGIQMNYQIEQ